MPFLSYAASSRRCRPGSVGAPLATLPNPIELTIPQLVVAQLLLGVYGDDAGLVAEMNWRVSSLLAVCGVPPPPVTPSRYVPSSRARGGPPHEPDLALNPAVAKFDPTEKGQLGYHLGTAVGVALVAYLNPAKARWFPMHLTRAKANKGMFKVGGKQPDVVAFAISSPHRKAQLTHFVVWENKGHLAPGPKDAIKEALKQARSLKNMTQLPGIAGTKGKPHPVAPRTPDAAIASQVDLPDKFFRVTTGDPEGAGGPPLDLGGEQGDDFFAGYYAPFRQVLDDPALQATRSIVDYDGRAFVTAELMPGLRMGLDAEIYNALTAGGPAGSVAAAVAGIVAVEYSNNASTEEVVHGSGLYVSVPMAYRTRTPPASAPLDPAPRPGPTPAGAARSVRGASRIRASRVESPPTIIQTPTEDVYVHGSAAAALNTIPAGTPVEPAVTEVSLAGSAPDPTSEGSRDPDAEWWRVPEKKEEERVSVRVPLLKGR